MRKLTTRLERMAALMEVKDLKSLATLLEEAKEKIIELEGLPNRHQQDANDQKLSIN